jgi:hypothetical protein
MAGPARVKRELAGLFLLVTGGMAFIGAIIWLLVIGQIAAAAAVLAVVVMATGYRLASYDPGEQSRVEERAETW